MKVEMEIMLPDMSDGEDDTLEAVVSLWSVDVGAQLKECDDLLEVTTDKAIFVVPSPCAGVLLEKRVHENDRVRADDVVAVLEADL